MEVEIIERQWMNDILARMSVFERAINAQQVAIGDLGRDIKELRENICELRMKVDRNDETAWQYLRDVSEEYEKLRDRISECEVRVCRRK